MRLLHAIAATCLALALHAVDPVLNSFHLEEQVRIISWSDMSAALVAQGLVANDANEFRILVDPSVTTTGTSDYLRANSTDAVVAGVTRVIKAGSPSPPTTTNSLYWRPLDDDFSINPGADDTPDFDPLVVATVQVFQGATQIGGNWLLKAHVKGVTDTRNGGYYNGTSSTDLTQPAAVDVVAGQNLVLTYQQIAAMCNWTDKERDGQLNRGGGPGFLARSACLIDNPVGSLQPDGTYVTTYLAYGGTMTIQIPADQPLGLNNLFNFVFEYDADGPGNVSTVDGRTNNVEFRVNVVSAGGSGSNSGGGGGGGCGAGTVGGLILLCAFSTLRRRRPYRV
jgi:hypothetical protein